MVAPPSQTERGTGVPWRSRSLLAILASTAVLPLGVPLLSPVLPALRDAFGLTDPAASLVFTVYYLPAVLLSPVLGAVIDRVGRKRTLVAMLVAWSLGGLVVAVGPPFEVVLASRLVQGTTAAAVLIVTVTLIGDVFDGVQRNAVIGVNVAVLLLAAAFAPLIGGVLVAYGWHVPFLVFVVGLPVAAFALWAVVEPDYRPARGGLAYVREAVVALPTGPAVGMYAAAMLVEFAAFGAILTAMPFVLAGSYDAAPVVIGAVVTANTLVGAAVSAGNGRLARRVSSPRLVAAGIVVVGLALPLAWVADGPLTFGGVSALFGVGYGLVLPSVDAAVNAIAPSSYRGGALSLRNSATFLGRGTGPVAFALVGSVTGYRPLLAVAGVGILAIGVAALAVTAS